MFSEKFLIHNFMYIAPTSLSPTFASCNSNLSHSISSFFHYFKPPRVHRQAKKREKFWNVSETHERKISSLFFFPLPSAGYVIRKFLPSSLFVSCNGEWTLKYNVTQIASMHFPSHTRVPVSTLYERECTCVSLPVVRSENL